MKSRSYLTFLAFFFQLLSCMALGSDTSLSSMATEDELSKRKLEAQWKVSLLGFQSTNVSEQRKLIRTNLEIQTDSYLMDDLVIHLRGALRFFSGTIQALNASDDEKNLIRLGEAGVHYSPGSLLVLSAGALDMRSTHSPLMLDAVAFPAVRAALQSGSLQNPDFRIYVESAIPTNTSLATDTQEFESTPEFQSAGIQYRTEWGQENDLKLSISGFRWGNLPGSVAAKSYVKGNSVNLFSETLGAFDYGYSGFEAEIKSQTYLTKALSIEPNLRYVQNTEAPAEQNQAWQANLVTTVHTDNQDYHFGLSRFEVQPDATVAYYGPTLLFNTNRSGYFLAFEVDFKKHGFSVGARYADAELIFDNPVQSRERSILVNLETNYADF